MSKKVRSSKRRPNMHMRSQDVLNSRTILYILAAVLIIRFFITLLPSYKIDMDGYRAWSLFLARKGFEGFYKNFHVVYAPFYMYMLWISGELAAFLRLSQEQHEFFIKFWAVASDIIGGCLIYLIGKGCNKQKTGVILGAVYALNPAIFFNSSVWGQFDSITATFLLGVVYLFKNKKDAFAAVLFGVAVLAKPQSVFFLPIVLALYFKDFSWKKTGEWIKIGLTAVVGILAYLVVTLPFASGRPVYWVIQLYLESAKDYPYATANGFNLWTLLGGQTINDSKPFMGLTYSLWGLILFSALALFCILVVIKGRGNPIAVYYSSYLTYFGAFMFITKMHERYLLPAFIFFCICLLWDKKLWVPFIILSLCHFANQWYLYDLAKRKVYWVARYDGIAIVLAFATLAVFAYSIIYGVKLINSMNTIKAKELKR